MTSFTDLLAPEPGLEPGAVQQRASQLLPARVNFSPMTWLTPGASPNGSGTKLLIGVSAWNRSDLQLLDRVRDVLGGRGVVGVGVTVFDLDQLGGPGDLQRLIPGIGPILQTPVVGYWEAGTFRESAAGFFGRRLVARTLGLDESTVHPPALAASR